jgi:hypothetical protein
MQYSLLPKKGSSECRIVYHRKIDTTARNSFVGTCVQFTLSIGVGCPIGLQGIQYSVDFFHLIVILLLEQKIKGCETV